MKREGDMGSQSRRERRSDEEGGRYGVHGVGEREKKR